MPKVNPPRVSTVPVVNPDEWPAIPETQPVTTPSTPDQDPALTDRNVEFVRLHPEKVLADFLNRAGLVQSTSAPTMLAVSDGSFILQKPTIITRYKDDR